MLLDPDLVRRPDIYQVSTLAFEAAGQRCPIGNLSKVSALRLIDVVQNLHQQEEVNATVSGTSTRASGLANFDCRVAPKQAATSINPRLRPKPYSNALCLNLFDSSPRFFDRQINKQQNNSCVENVVLDPGSSRKASCGNADEYCLETLKSSAFRPYSASNDSSVKVLAAGFTIQSCETVDVTVSSTVNLSVENDDISWNPFLIAPFSSHGRSSSALQIAAMDDHSFGHCFDKLPRHLKYSTPNKVLEEDANLKIDENDPFSAAPIHHYQVRLTKQISGMKDTNICCN